MLYTEEFKYYNPKVDIQEVEQFGFIDLAESYANGYVDGSLEIDDETFNGIEDPANIGVKVTDPIEAVQRISNIRNAPVSNEENKE